MELIRYQNDVLHIDHVSVEMLTEEVETPFYAYSQTQLEYNFNSLKHAFNDKALICYAVKANSHQAVMSVIASLGGGADVVSLGELKRALKAGIPASKIVFSGVGKSHAEIEFAIACGVLQFNVESIAELKRISQIAQSKARVANIALRINPDVSADTHEKISTGKAENKFGIDYKEALATYRLASTLPNLNVNGIHVHIGSQITSLEPFAAAFERIKELITALKLEGITLNVIDLGGGIGVCYDKEQDSPFSYHQYATLAQETFGEFEAQLVIEPGRSMVANCGILVSKVNYVKHTKTKQFVIIDAGMNNFARPSLYDAYHLIAPVRLTNNPLVVYDIVGPVCETGDTFAKNRRIPSLNENDYVFIKDTGAYGACMSSTYNSRPLTTELMVKGNQVAKITTPESIESLIDKDQLPNWL